MSEDPYDGITSQFIRQRSEPVAGGKPTCGRCDDLRDRADSSTGADPVSKEHFENWLRREAVRFRTPMTWTGNVEPLVTPIMLTPERADRLADLVAAVREMLKFGEHEGDCTYDSNGECIRHVHAFEMRERAVQAALAALDEASR